MSAAPKILAEKCARAKALMEEARALIEEVLDVPTWHHQGVLPRGVSPEGAMCYLPDAIGMLEPRPDWNDDDVPPGRPTLRVLAGGVR